MSITKDQILDAIAKMSIMDITELVLMVEKKFGISSASSTVTSKAPVEVIEDEKTEFDVILNTIGINKIAVIKAVRGAVGLGLKEAKDLVESAPVIIKEGINKNEAKDLKESLEKIGASIEIK